MLRNRTKEEPKDRRVSGTCESSDQIEILTQSASTTIHGYTFRAEVATEKRLADEKHTAVARLEDENFAVTLSTPEPVKRSRTDLEPVIFKRSDCCTLEVLASPKMRTRPDAFDEKYLKISTPCCTAYIDITLQDVPQNKLRTESNTTPEVDPPSNCRVRTVLSKLFGPGGCTVKPINDVVKELYSAGKNDRQQMDDIQSNLADFLRSGTHHHLKQPHGQHAEENHRQAD